MRLPRNICYAKQIRFLNLFVHFCNFLLCVDGDKTYDMSIENIPQSGPCLKNVVCFWIVNVFWFFYAHFVLCFDWCQNQNKIKYSILLHCVIINIVFYSTGESPPLKSSTIPRTQTKSFRFSFWCNLILKRFTVFDFLEYNLILLLLSSVHIHCSQLKRAQIYQRTF